MAAIHGPPKVRCFCRYNKVSRSKPEQRENNEPARPTVRQLFEHADHIDHRDYRKVNRGMHCENFRHFGVHGMRFVLSAV